MKRYIILFSILFSITFTPCYSQSGLHLGRLIGFDQSKIEEKFDQLDRRSKDLIKILDNALYIIDQYPERWEQVMKSLIQEFDRRGHQLIRGDIEMLYRQAVQATTIQIACLAEQIPNLIKESIATIELKALFGSGKKTIEPESYFRPKLCDFNPPIIDLNLEKRSRTVIHANGMNFESQNFNDPIVTFHYTNEEKSEFKVANNIFYRISDYRFAIKLDGISDREIAMFDHIRIRFNGKTSKIPIIRQSESFKIVQALLPPYTHYPQHIQGGDRDFNAHGPDIDVYFQFVIEEKRVGYKINMKAVEDGGDGTVGKSWSPVQWFYYVEEGYRAIDVVGERTYHIADYRYENGPHGPDTFDFLFGKFEIIGDTAGDDLVVQQGRTSARFIPSGGVLIKLERL